MHPDVLRLYAKHYKTGEVIPDSLIEKISKSSTFNQGFMTTELVAAALLDMDWHSVTASTSTDVRQFEQQAMKTIGLIDVNTWLLGHAFGRYDAGIMPICGQRCWMPMRLIYSRKRAVCYTNRSFIPYDS